MLFAVAAFTSVYCEGATVPASTTIIEKAIMATPVVLTAFDNGAIVSPLIMHSDFVHGYNVEIASLDKIHWVVDETFYAIGYKSLLNKEVREIFAPPKVLIEKIFTSNYCQGINHKKQRGATGRNPRDGLSYS